MDPGAPVEEIVLATKWFQLVARQVPSYREPHYSIRTLDYVHVVAVTTDGALLLVRQFRPALWKTTLELPSGHVEPGQTPEQAARAELLEETGYEAETFELLGDCAPDSGRLGNRMWQFFAENAQPKANQTAEAGIELILHRGTVDELMQDGSFCSALNHAALFRAVLHGKIGI